MQHSLTDQDASWRDLEILRWLNCAQGMSCSHIRNLRGWLCRSLPARCQRSLVETTIGRYKHIIGPKLRARSSGCQQSEVAIAAQVLNRMIRIAKSISVRPG